MIGPTRRDALAGAAAAVAAPSADATLAGLMRDTGGDRGDGPWRLTDETAEGADARRRRPAELLARLRAISVVDLSPSARLDHDTITAHTTLEARLGREFPFGAGPGRPYVVDARTGSHRLAAAGLGGPEPAAATDEAYRDALRRAARNLDGETERLRAAADGFGVVPPTLVLRRAEAAVRAAAALTGEASPLSRRALDRTAAEALVDREVRPALVRQADALAALAPRAGAGLGVDRFREGATYHALTMRLSAGVDLETAAAEALARDAVARLQSELHARLRAEGLTSGSFGERLRAMMRRPAGLYGDDNAGRDAAAADMNAVVAAARGRLDRLFLNPPSGAVGVVRMSAADTAAERAGYREATGAGGVYRPDLHALRRRPRWTLPTVACHEVTPGHLLQIQVEAAAAPPPLRVRCAPGYFEGWAVYAETLGAELDLYDGPARIGHLQSLLMRLSRVLLDAGVHRHGWSAGRARAELAGLYGDGLFNSLDAEVERTATTPAAGVGDALGWLEIARLRRVRGGDSRVFHRAVLARGPYPPRTLARAVALG